MINVCYVQPCTCFAPALPLGTGGKKVKIMLGLILTFAFGFGYVQCEIPLGLICVSSSVKHARCEVLLWDGGAEGCINHNCGSYHPSPIISLQEGVGFSVTNRGCVEELSECGGYDYRILLSLAYGCHWMAWGSYSAVAAASAPSAQASLLKIHLQVFMTAPTGF